MSMSLPNEPPSAALRKPLKGQRVSVVAKVLLVALCLLTPALSASASRETPSAAMTSRSELPQRPARIVSPAGAYPAVSSRLAPVPPVEGPPLDYLETRSTAVPDVTLTRVTTSAPVGDDLVQRRSHVAAWNVDETLLSVGEQLLDAQTFLPVFPVLPVSIDRVWSAVDPRIIYGVRHPPDSAEFVRVDLGTGRTDLLARLDGHERCSIGDGEGGISYDDRRIVLTCQGGPRGREAISFDLATRSVSGRLSLGDGHDWISVTPSGRHVVQRLSDHFARYDTSLGGRAVIGAAVEYGDLALDANGDDVFVEIDGSAFAYTRIADGARVNLEVGAPGFGHVSCRNVLRPGVCYFTSYDEGLIGAVELGIADTTPVGTTDTGAAVYRGVSRVENWGRTQTSASSPHSQANGVVSPTGRQVLFTSDWEGREEISDYVLTYRPAGADG